MMDERGRYVGGIESFLQQTLDEVILFFVFTAGERGAEFVEEQAPARTSWTSSAVGIFAR